MDSLWTDTSKKPKFQPLDQDKKTDVLIIGGGMAGVLCAYLLQQAGVNYILVEADGIGSGITQDTTAKITSQHGLFYRQMVKRFGADKARLYLEVNQLALDQYRQLCQKIDCDFETKDAYVYSLDDYDKIEDEYKALKGSDFSCHLEKNVPLPFSISGALRFENQAQFHPLKFLYAISKGLNIYEHTKVQELVPQKRGAIFATTAHASVEARKIIVATHFPFINKHGSYFLKMYQHRSYVIALENGPDVEGMYIDEADNGLSFRNYKNLLLIGGGGHRTGKSGGNWAELERFSLANFTKMNIKYRWATQDCMTLDSIPYIGPYSGSTNQLYVATGFNKWGMTSSMVAAMILSDLVQEKENKYSPIFSPSRSMLRPQLMANGWEATMGLLTPKTKRCPHMGCALKWNATEHTWDCSCHGSRFTEDGKLIDNPATGDLKETDRN